MNVRVNVNYFSLLSAFCLLSHFAIIRCIVKSLTATLTYFKSLIATLRVFWAPEFGHLNRYTGLLNGLDTSLTNYSSSTSFLKVHHRTSLGTLSRAFSKSTNANYKFHFFFLLHISPATVSR